MNEKPEIYLIREDNFEMTVMRAVNPVLILCMSYDDQHAKQVDMVSDAVSKYRWPLIIGLLDESFVGSFKKKYQVAGTPTFMIIKEGKEISRLLGLADEYMLAKMIQEAYPALGQNTNLDIAK